MDEKVADIACVQSLNDWAPSKQLPVPTSEFAQQFPALESLAAELGDCVKDKDSDDDMAQRSRGASKSKGEKEHISQKSKPRGSHKKIRHSVKVKRKPKRVSLKTFLRGMANPSVPQSASPSRPNSEMRHEQNEVPCSSICESSSLPNLDIPSEFQQHLNDGLPGSKPEPLSLPDINAGKKKILSSFGYDQNGRKGVRRRRVGSNNIEPSYFSPIHASASELLSPDKREGFYATRKHLQGDALSAAVKISQLVADPLQREVLRNRFKHTVNDGARVKVQNKLGIEDAQKVLGEMGVRLTKANLHSLLSCGQQDVKIQKVGFQDLLRHAETALYVDESSDNKLLQIADGGKSLKRQGRAVGKGPAAKYNPLHSHLLADHNSLALQESTHTRDLINGKGSIDDWNSYWSDKVIDKPGWSKKGLGGMRKKHLEQALNSVQDSIPKPPTMASLLSQS